MVDLLISASLIALLVAIALPMSSAWVEGVEDSRVEAVLEQAEVKAQSMAMRNPNGILNREGKKAAVAALCYEPSQGAIGRVVVYLRETNGVFAPCEQVAREQGLTNAREIWAETVDISDLVGRGFEEACFDNHGAVLAPEACTLVNDGGAFRA